LIATLFQGEPYWAKDSSPKERDVRRGLFAKAAVLLCGCALGATAAYGIARALQLREGRVHLQQDAGRLVAVGEQMAANTDDAVRTLAAGPFPFCSDEDLAFMRTYVYNATHIRDLGRVQNGQLICSTGIGRMTSVIPMPKPDLDLGGMKVYARAPLMIAKNTTGFIVEVAGVSVVMNPESYKSLDESPMFFSALLYDRGGQRLLPAFGHDISLTNAEIIAGKYIEKGAAFYEPRCSRHGMLCVVAAEPRAAMLARNSTLFVGFLLGGALLGGAVGLILIQFYRLQRSMEKQLRRAIRKGALSVVYQPIVKLETKEIVGAEALVRWIGDDGQSVRPDVFVALAEEHRFVGEITRFVTRRVAEELGNLLASRPFRVTVNIASQDLADPQFVSHLTQSLSAAKVAPASIGLELTERSTADQKIAVRVLAQLKNAGHVVYIDDFGTGYSSLAYLHELDVDAIKVDRAFTQTVGTEAVTASVVPQILAMAEQLGLLVVVEGIETEEQAAYFRSWGRGILGQGWLFGKPVAAGRLRKLVEGSKVAA
jgi:sensor c-di-GMP phosphodiesterase-like protein